MMTTLNMHPMMGEASGSKQNFKNCVQIEGNYVKINGVYYNLNDINNYS